MEQKPEIKGRVGEGDLNVLVAVRRRFRVVLIYASECLADVRVLRR